MKPLQALQATLAAEHAAVYVYAAIGGRLASSEHPATAGLFEAAYTAHRGRRDRLRSLVAGLGATPVAASPAYAVDALERDPEHLVGVARRTEDRCAAVYAQLVASSVGGDRRWAVELLTDASVRALSFGAEPTAYPGLPALA